MPLLIAASIAAFTGIFLFAAAAWFSGYFFLAGFSCAIGCVWLAVTGFEMINQSDS